MPFQCVAQKFYFSIFIFNFSITKPTKSPIMAEKFRSRKFFLTKKKSVDECCDTNSQNSFFLRTFSPETWPNNVLFSTIFSYLFRFDSSRWQVCVRAHVKSTRKEFKRWNGLTTCAKQFTTFFSSHLVRFQLNAATIVEIQTSIGCRV